MTSSRRPHRRYGGSKLRQNSEGFCHLMVPKKFPKVAREFGNFLIASRLCGQCDAGHLGRGLGPPGDCLARGLTSTTLTAGDSRIVALPAQRRSVSTLLAERIASE